MDRYVALLRGINVGGKRKLPMKALAALCEEAGCEKVVTFIASGNVAFDASAKLAGKLKPTLERAILKEFGFEVPVILRTRGELLKACANNPFLGREEDLSKLGVVYLADAPARALIEALDPNRSPPDAFAVRGNHMYLHLPNGFGRSKLTSDWIDRSLRTTGTARNWRTALKLCDL